MDAFTARLREDLYDLINEAVPRGRRRTLAATELVVAAYAATHDDPGLDGLFAGHMSAVHALVRNDSGALAVHLIRRGLNPDHILAACFELHVPGTACIRAALTHGADPNIMTDPNHTGNTLLHAVQCPVATRLLLAHGADPGRKNFGGFTPFHLAVLSRRFLVAEALLPHVWVDASIGPPGVGRTALEEIVGRHPFHQIAGAVAWLLLRGARPTAAALVTAARCGNSEVVHHLVMFGAPVGPAAADPLAHPATARHLDRVLRLSRKYAARWRAAVARRRAEREALLVEWRAAPGGDLYWLAHARWHEACARREAVRREGPEEPSGAGRPHCEAVRLEGLEEPSGAGRPHCEAVRREK